MPSYKTATVVTPNEHLGAERLLDQLLTQYLLTACSFINSNYDLWLRHFRALGQEEPEQTAKLVYAALSATAGKPIDPEAGPEAPVIYPEL